MNPTPQPHYLLFTSMVKHGELLRYLLAAQVRKRLMETYGFHRQGKYSPLTRNPDKIFENYYAEEPPQVIGALNTLCADETFRACHQLIEEARITSAEKRSPMDPPPLRALIQMDYLTEVMSQQKCAQSHAEAPYLLHVTCTLLPGKELSDFNNYMRDLLEVFANSGMLLVVAGQYADIISIDAKSKDGRLAVEVKPKTIQEPTRILNVWQFQAPDSPRLLMSRLAENLLYSRLDDLCTQEQHICRNVSRHYQRYPLLSGATLNL